MENLLLKSKNIHCIGIGGTGLSALASVLGENGKIITGSDANSGGHDKGNISNVVDLVIYSEAIPSSNIERVEAEKKNIKQITYATALGLLSKSYKTIAICGTHGKTTTTAMIASCLIKPIDPTVIVGSISPDLNNNNYHVGKGEHLIIEACEYRRSFLNYHPNTILISNIEVDHLDYFKDEEDYISSFREFLHQITKDGVIIANIDDNKVSKLCNEIAEKRPDITFYTYGKNKEAQFEIKGNDIYKKNKKIASFNLKIPGTHNIYNATAALICSLAHSSLTETDTARKLDEFTGTNRRFEQFTRTDGIIVIDDYAHHPTAINATLGALREKFGKDKKVLCIFQPHQYSRTKILFKKFANSFTLADEVIIPNIYDVRDSDESKKDMSPEILVREIQKHHHNVNYGKGLEKTLLNVKSRITDFDIIITMGAGDITNLFQQLK